MSRAFKTLDFSRITFEFVLTDSTDLKCTSTAERIGLYCITEDIEMKPLPVNNPFHGWAIHLQHELVDQCLLHIQALEQLCAFQCLP